MWKQVPKYLERELDLVMMLPRPLRLRSQSGELYYWYEEIKRPKLVDNLDQDLEPDPGLD